jgi:hypothetical protein
MRRHACLPQKNELGSALCICHAHHLRLCCLLLLLEGMRAQCCFASVLSSIIAIFLPSLKMTQDTMIVCPPQPSVPSSPLPVHGFLSSAKSAHSNIEKPNAKPTVVLPSNSWRRRPRCSLDRRYSIRWTQSRKYLVFITVFFFHYCYSLQSSYFPSKWTIHIQDQLWFFRPSLLYNIARPRSTAGDGTVP